uniref:Uncharacterized protein n=1 Tax=Lactuca sativa TaxID=4236 RepID=A0A9R1X2Y0_LACSA|nr:hypothetical protein LSAT_V11C700355930 [Lactuca sativa]
MDHVGSGQVHTKYSYGLRHYIQQLLPLYLNINITDFKKIFNKLVWYMYIERDVFEWNWELLMKEFNLEDERWFKDIFENKEA